MKHPTYYDLYYKKKNYFRSISVLIYVLRFVRVFVLLGGFFCVCLLGFLEAFFVFCLFVLFHFVVVVFSDLEFLYW